MFGLREWHRNEFLHARVFMGTITKPYVTLWRTVDTAGKKCPILLKNMEKRAEIVRSTAYGRALFARGVNRSQKGNGRLRYSAHELMRSNDHKFWSVVDL